MMGFYNSGGKVLTVRYGLIPYIKQITFRLRRLMEDIPLYLQNVQTKRIVFPPRKQPLIRFI